MDISLKEVQSRMEQILKKNPSAMVYVKWTCPKCRRRCIASMPNTIYLGGYKHDECGTIYNGSKYGMHLELKFEDRL